MSRAPERRMFYTIDGLRGIAALLIVCRHIVPLHGGQLDFQSSYLAVELFFLFSGFVIAHAYDKRLEAGLGFWEFVRVRLIRLYPLYFLGFFIGVMTTVAAQVLHMRGAWPLKPWVILPNLFILPTPVWFSGGTLFPFDNPSWTLFFELVANFVYALVVKHLTTGRLALIVVLCAAWLAVTAFAFGSLDVGYNMRHFVGGFPRVFFSFFAGVGVYRLQMAKPCPVKINPWILMAAACVLLGARIPDGLGRELYDSLCAIVVFPAFAYLATAVEPGSSRVQKMFALGGGASYALYLIHAPLGGVLHLVFVVVGQPRGNALVGITFIAVVSVIALLVEKYYDAPVRRWLNRLTGAKPKRPAAIA